MIRGSEFYLDLAVEPERCLKLVMLCAESLAAAEKHFREVANQGDDEFFSQFCIAGLGLRLGEDSLINVSPDIIMRSGSRQKRSMTRPVNSGDSKFGRPVTIAGMRRLGRGALFDDVVM